MIPQDSRSVSSNNIIPEASETSDDDVDGEKRKRLEMEVAKIDLDLIKREALEKIREEQEKLRQKVFEIVDDMMDQIVEYVQASTIE